MDNWEDQLDAWEAKYQPIKNHIDPKAYDKFETYGEELDYVLSIANTEPARVWTLVDGDDGNLYITSGYHLVNRVNYFITKNPCEFEYEETPYYIFEEDEDDCKYCGGDCPKDEEHACDSYLGDIDNLYKEQKDEL